MDCKYYDIKCSFELFLSDCLLSLHVVLFFLFGCSLSDLWTPEAVEDLLSYFPSFIVYHSYAFCFSSCLDVASLIYGFLRRQMICCHLSHVSSFITQMLVVVFFLSGCIIFDLWIPKAVEDLLTSCPCFIVYHLDTFCLPSPHHHINPLSDRQFKCLHYSR